MQGTKARRQGATLGLPSKVRLFSPQDVTVLTCQGALLAAKMLGQLFHGRCERLTPHWTIVGICSCQWLRISRVEHTGSNLSFTCASNIVMAEIRRQLLLLRKEDLEGGQLGALRYVSLGSRHGFRGFNAAARHG